MDHVSLDELDSRMGPADVTYPLGSALDAANLAENYYELAPGDSFGYGYHRHGDQEELFLVVEGTATFETEDGDVDVGAGEAIRFDPGEWQLGRNEGTDRVVALAVGAPAEMGETEMIRPCEDCGGRTANRIEMAEDREAILTVCERCGGETGRFD